MKKIIVALGLLTLLMSTVSAQDENDAIRYGNINYFGTARGMSIGSALGSVGGDFSTISVNPAGLGIYRKSEFSFTPSFSVNNNDGNYLGSGSTARDSRFNFSEFGLVFTKANNVRNKKSRWKTASFAIGMNRLNNFTNQFTYSGKNNQSSIVNKWANDFNALGGLNNSSLSSVSYPAYAAYQTYLIDRDPNDSLRAKSFVPLDGDGIQQTKSVTEKGGMQEYVIAGGGNYMEKLMLGGSIGIVTVRYSRSSQFNENDISGNGNNDFKYLRFNESLLTTGTGYNLKLGMIYKFNKNFRMGVALHTPTHIEFTDQSSIDMESHTEGLLLTTNQFSSITKYEQDTTQAFNYSMNTPYKAILSGTFLFSRFGFLTADIEYVDYASMKYNFGIGYQGLSSDLNTVMQNVYRSTTNIRVGGEVKLEDVYVRAGFGYYGSPYQNSGWDAAQTNISGGVGYRGGNWFLDLAFVHSRQNFYENAYVLTGGKSPTAAVSTKTGNAMMTLGWKF